MYESLTSGLSTIEARLNSSNVFDEAYESDFNDLVAQFYTESNRLVGSSTTRTRSGWNFKKDLDSFCSFFNPKWNHRLLRAYAGQSGVSPDNFEAMMAMSSRLNGISHKISSRKLAIQKQVAGKDGSGDLWGTIWKYSRYICLNLLSVVLLYLFVQGGLASHLATFFVNWGVSHVYVLQALLFSALAVLQTGLLCLFSKHSFSSLWDRLKFSVSNTRFDMEKFAYSIVRLSLANLITSLILWFCCQPILSLPLFFINALFFSALRFIQTLAEELVARRPLLDDNIDPYTKCVVGVIQSLCFALAHYYAIAAYWCQSLWDYFICFFVHFCMGLRWTIQTLCSKTGIEIAWGEHIGNNLGIDMIKVALGNQNFNDSLPSEPSIDSVKSPYEEIAKSTSQSTTFLISTSIFQFVHPLASTYLTHARDREYMPIRPIVDYSGFAAKQSSKSPVPAV